MKIIKSIRSVSLIRWSSLLAMAIVIWAGWTVKSKLMSAVDFFLAGFNLGAFLWGLMLDRQRWIADRLFEISRDLDNQMMELKRHVYVSKGEMEIKPKRKVRN